MTANSEIYDLLKEAWDLRRTGQYEEAKACVFKAENLSTEKDYNVRGRIYHIYMQFESDHSNYKEALVYSKLSVANYKKADNPNRIAHALRHMAHIKHELDMNLESESDYRQAIQLYRNLPHTHDLDLANALRSFALLLEKIDKTKEAIAMWTEAQILYENSHIQAGVDEATQKLRELS